MATGGREFDLTNLSDTEECATADTSFSAAQSVASVLSDFKDSPVYVLQFSYKQRGKSNPNVILVKEFVVRLRSNELLQAINDLKRRLNVTDVQVDDQNRVIKLEDTHRGRGLDGTTLLKAVLSQIRKQNLSLLRWEVVNVGLQAANIKRQIDDKFSASKLFCEISQDNQKLLLLSADQDVMMKAVPFAWKRNLIATVSSDFKTLSGIKVSVIKKDINTVIADCVVSAVDETMSLNGGASKAIADVAGPGMLSECRGRIKAKGHLRVTDVFVSSGGERWKYVLHACGPRWSAHQDKVCCQQLTQTIRNCLEEAHRLNLGIIALPLVSSGSFEVPIDKSKKCYLDAIETFDKDFGKLTSIKHIQFVDIIAARVSELQIQMDASRGLEKAITLRLVLLGKTGVGKSSTGNSILRNKSFDCKKALQAVTQESSLKTSERSGRMIEVVDTPGLFDKAYDTEHEQHILQEILKAVILCLPGPHAFLLVFSGNERYSKTEQEVCSKITELFSQTLLHFLIVVFTHVSSQSEMEELIASAPVAVHNLLNSCGGRVVGIENQDTFDQQHDDIDRLMQIALDLQETNGGQSVFFSNELINRCMQLLQSDKFGSRSIDEIKREIQTERTRRTDMNSQELLEDQRVRTETKRAERTSSTSRTARDVQKLLEDPQVRTAAEEARGCSVM